MRPQWSNLATSANLHGILPFVKPLGPSDPNTVSIFGCLLEQEQPDQLANDPSHRDGSSAFATVSTSDFDAPRGAALVDSGPATVLLARTRNFTRCQTMVLTPPFVSRSLSAALRRVAIAAVVTSAACVPPAVHRGSDGVAV
jgi:hypothetical protein